MNDTHNEIIDLVNAKMELLEALRPFAEAVWGVDFRFEHNWFPLPLQLTTSTGRSVSVSDFRKAMEVYKKMTEGSG